MSKWKLQWNKTLVYLLKQEQRPMTLNILNTIVNNTEMIPSIRPLDVIYYYLPFSMNRKAIMWYCLVYIYGCLSPRQATITSGGFLTSLLCIKHAVSLSLSSRNRKGEQLSTRRGVTITLLTDSLRLTSMELQGCSFTFLSLPSVGRSVYSRRASGRKWRCDS